MSHWTSKNAILRDLSEAQGHGVPVDIVDAVASGDRPPTPNFVEETEEEYFEHCTGAGDALPVPDFGLIRQMLNVVQQSNTSPDDDDDHHDNKILDDVVTSKINASKEANNTTQVNKKINTKRIDRNVAVQSILRALGKEICNGNQVKNNDKIEDSRVLDNNILHQKTTNSVNPDNVNSRQNSPANNRPLALDPANMFRKKTPSKKPVSKEESIPYVEKNINVETYKPSELASEYYKRYVDRMKIKESIQDDIWTRAEKKMKEIEAMKKLQTSDVAQSSSMDNKTEVSKIWDKINLPQHRHLLSGDCIVCEVLLQRGYRIDLTLL